ncbi:MAG: transglycosylase SLT domain-containing protein [Thermaerobacter sp.]|jgi:soluble lytic murein transglycosylase-like protein|nr:transglycosylase SLT domain-containing protein [Thermaerobacter sp.]
MHRRWTALVTLLGFTLATAGVAGAASLSQLQAKHAKLQQQISGERSTLHQTTAAADSVQAQLNAVDASLNATRNRLATIDAQEMQVAGQLTRGEAKLAALKAKLVRQKHQVAAALRIIQEHGVVSYVAVVLGSNSFSDFVGRLEMLRTVVHSQVDILKEVHAEELQEAQQVVMLQQQKAHLVALAQQAQRTAATYRTQAQKRQSLLDQLFGQANSEQTVINQLKTQDAGLMAAIQQLEFAMYNHNIPPGEIGTIVAAVAKEYGLDPALVWAIIRQESGGNPNAVSTAGAEGLMQLMPGTAAEMGVTNPFNAQQNIQGGVAYFAYLLKLFNGNIALALAAYNAGPGAVQKYGGIPPYQQTQNYVRDILGSYSAGK